jgi:hypothetical protein
MNGDNQTQNLHGCTNYRNRFFHKVNERNIK